MSCSKSSKHQYGSPLKILTFEQDIDETKMVIHYQNLDKIFLHPEVANRSVVILSVIGALRKGKSFFLDYCLRFLYANYKSVNYMSNPINDAANWMGGSEIPLTGFSWKNGSSRDTSGIVFWSDVFLATMNDGEKVAIILMDTQGLFDKDTTPADNSRIFSLATLISSVQIFNIMSRIKENELQYLQLAVDLSKLADKDNQNSFETKPFQKLLFLIRDWCHPNEYSFGFNGGKKYIQEQLKENKNQYSSLKSVREYIFSSFEKISCCLLPEPGRSVKITGYDGRWSMMESDFKNELKMLIERTLHPIKIVIKKLNNQSLVGAEIKKYFEIYLEAFKSNKNVCAQTIYDMNLEQQMKDLIENGSKNYNEQLKRINFDDMEDFEKRIDGVHCNIKENVTGEFLRAIQMRSKEQQLHFQNKFESKLEDILIDTKKNISENIRIKEEEDENQRKIKEEEKMKETQRKIQEEEEKDKMSSLNLLTFEQDFDETKMVIHNENLDKIFLHPEVANRSVVIVSVIGAFREGKSFFLDYCLRFLYANYKSVNYMSNPINDAANWMGGSEIPLTGFSWKNGSSRDTTGIILWSDVFLTTMEDGEKVAIILMDTQGLFDTETTPADNSRIFSLATLISSVQIFNIMSRIKEDQLQYLQLAIDLSKLADKDNQYSIETKPFQKLLFLIRDWINPDEYSFGLEGGQKYIKKQLEIKDNQYSSLKSVREYIFSSFEEISCCLLPEPGKPVKKTGYDGRWSMMESDFKNELKMLIERTLHPIKLVIKKLNNQSLVGAELKKYFEIYLEAFKLRKNVCARTIYDMNLEQQMKDLIENGSKSYEEQLKIIPFDDMEDFEKRIGGVHCDIKENVIIEFSRAIRMRSKEQQLHFQNMLESKLKEILIDWKRIVSANIKLKEEEKKLKEEKRKMKEEEEKMKEKERKMKEKEEKLKENQRKFDEEIQIKIIEEEERKVEEEKQRKLREKEEEENLRRIKEKMKEQQKKIKEEEEKLKENQRKFDEEIQIKIIEEEERKSEEEKQRKLKEKEEEKMKEKQRQIKEEEEKLKEKQRKFDEEIQIKIKEEEERKVEEENLRKIEEKMKEQLKKIKEEEEKLKENQRKFDEEIQIKIIEEEERKSEEEKHRKIKEEEEKLREKHRIIKEEEKLREEQRRIIREKEKQRKIKEEEKLREKHRIIKEEEEKLREEHKKNSCFNSLKHQYGNPLKILTFEQDIDETKMVVHYQNLDKIFLHPEVANRSVVILSVIGALRKGKSFFLDYCLRFLYANYKSVNYMSNPINDAANWMGGSEIPLTGFSWKNGPSRDTSGIILWSDVFLATMNDGEKVAIILMDTQGLFDKETTPADYSRIFSLATLMSSVQIFNIMGLIEETQLQYLQLAIDLSRLADKDNQYSIETKPFQKLLFLIRDWINPDEYSFGLEGGYKYIQKQLDIKYNQYSSLKSVCEYIFSTFEEISCCLLPEPGRPVKKTGYDGRWSIMEEDFRDELKILIEKTLHIDNLVIKKLNNQSLVGAELKKYFEKYLEAFKSNENVNAQTIYEIHLQQQI